MQVLIIFVYILPTLVALGVKNRNWPAIAVLNLALGWTYIGWIIALIWAVARR